MFEAHSQSKAQSKCEAIMDSRFNESQWEYLTSDYFYKKSGKWEFFADMKPFRIPDDVKYDFFSLNPTP